MSERVSPSKQRLWMALAPALTIPFLASLVYFILLKDSEGAQPAYTAAKVFLIVWPFAATLFVLKKPLGLRNHPLRHHLRALPLGALIGFLIVCIMGAWMLSPLGKWIVSGAPGVKAKVISLGIEGDRFLLFAVFVTFAHSFIEEFYWRWFVYGNLRYVIPKRRAHVVAAITFAAHHLVVTSQFFPFAFACFLSFCVAVGGFIWSQLYERQRSLAGAWVSHLVVDAGLMIIGYHLLQQ